VIKGLSKLISSVCAGALLMAGPAIAGTKSSLEDTFDTAFARAQAQPQTQAPAKAPKAAPIARAAVPLVAFSPFGSAPTTSYSTPFEAQLTALANSAQGRIGVAAVDLATGRTVAVLGDQPFPMASTSKIAIAATFLAGVDQGRYRLTDQYPLMIPVPSRKFAGASAPVKAGTMMSAQELIELALTRSDNHAADALLAAVGGPQVVTGWVRTNTGIADFRLDRTIATLVRDDGAINPAFSIDRRDSVTPLAMVKLLAGFYRGDWLSPQSSAVLLGAMERCRTGKYRMKAMLPEGTQLAHKTGTLSSTASDVGIIRTADGRELAVAIYVTGQGTKAARDARIAMLARAIYDGYLAEASGDRRTVLR